LVTDSESEELTDYDEPPRKGSTPQTKKVASSGSRKDDKGRGGEGEELWTEDLDEVLRVGLKLIPKMGRRSIQLNTKSDQSTYGRVGLLSEYLRRQTGKHRDRNKISSHLGIQRKHAVKVKDKERESSLSSLSTSRFMADHAGA
jgi:hypothetical protein